MGTLGSATPAMLIDHDSLLFHRLYDLKRRKELGALLQHQGTITALTFHNKTHMLSGSDDGKICVWRSKDWECLKIMKGHQNTVHSIAIHPSGKIALSVAADHSVRLWNLLLGKQASMTRLPQGAGLKVVWNPSGTGYSIMFDQEIGVFDMAVSFFLGVYSLLLPLVHWHV